MGSANKHGDVPGRSRPCLDHRDRPLALVQPGIHAASSEAGARRHRRYSHASTDSFSAAKGPAFLQNFQLRGASIFRYPLVPSIWRTSISPQVPFMSHHCLPTRISGSHFAIVHWPSALAKVLPAQVARAARSAATSQLARRAQHVRRRGTVKHLP